MRGAPVALAPVLLLGLLLASPAPGESRKAALKELMQWADGPVRWLLLPDEWKRLKQVASSSEGLAFVDAFWERRDADPQSPGNVYREIFARRVEAADLLYAEPRLRGSLTDRGRALILLGPPANVQLRTESGLAWDAKRRSGRRVTTREVPVEIWGYRLADLPQTLFQASLESVRKPDEALTLTLTFVTDAKTTYLADGENLLNLAARAAVTRPVE